ncbi:ABC transporter substrate-binding protein [Deinococcus soli (ex Cha et al. 2016)]|uniref:Branched-chain amino acid transport system substrate-binding protein n=2 Tax=Deinococcus soli (ex Cha et al. 2016) TaxID=1309411 RepID=A0ACC6KBG6_9DEIO|nr:ABC transporter substrate-binding protein [Deinococcus soli (ex Cha et al. 2016)]MDR6216703.1 branched-chain amino acid transport system substrate-binding protein [Deinococcus soli (ex Cha et al. 2016)]MDR6327524.1 branched-chain amino acid transport system substrate-binding protein [Deinococcus soli (ex Cha et al. 2016)]MDR6749799.1 branched-chain amino acid transport system substrate-binding protein [Deinococcus soli (ex Cha et al. 2016)]
MKTLLMTGVLLALSGAGAVKVGVLLPLSGAGSVSGQAAKNGYQLALDEINKAGGVLGKPLELEFADDGSAPAKAVPEFVKLVTVEKVDFMAGGVSSATSIAISGPAKQYNTFMAWIGAAAVPVEDAFADHPYFFHYHPWSYYNFEAILGYFKYLKTYKKAKNIAIAYEDGPFGSAGIDATVDAFKKAGFTVVMTEKFKTGSGNFGPLVSKAKAAKPDILYWVGYDTDALPLATEIKQQNLQLGLLYGTPPSWPVGFEKNSLSDNVAGLSLWLSTSPTKDSRAFVAAYRKKYGTVTDEYFAPLAYVNLKTLAAAINRAGTTDKAKVAAEMARTNVSTPFGQLTFSPSLKTKYQGFKAGNWLHFQYLGDARVPVFPIKFAQKPMVYGK